MGSDTPLRALAPRPMPIPETAPSRQRGRSLFAQIALRLVTLAAIFAVLDVAIVVANYATDDQALAEDFIEQQAHRIDRTLRRADGATARLDLANMSRPFGVSAWRVTIVGDRLTPLLQVGDVAASPFTIWPTRDTLDWTRRDLRGGEYLISGARRFTGPAGAYWVLVAAQARGRSLYGPVILRELLDHVALPLIPLMGLLLVFNVQVVRRMLLPLNSAVSQVDALDPSHMEARLSDPADSREVAVLVSAVNRALDRLQEAMGLLKTFTADAAHELRTPLAVLNLRIDQLPEGESRRRLSEEVQTMSRLVNQMLDLAQADALRLDAAADVDLNALAREVIAQTAPLAFAGGHDVRLVEHGKAVVRGHADALGRVIRNLIENAVRHAGRPGPIEVTVGPGARLQVMDLGQGFAPLDGETLFRRFWRRQRGAGGSGLGLGIVRSIVEAHGGTVSAVSPRSGGALFVCQFPEPVEH